MLTQELKDTIKSMPQTEREELSAYMLKLRLEEDTSYWERIRERTANYHPEHCSDVKTIK